MAETLTRKPPVHYPPEIWLRVRGEACKGVSFPTLSKLYGPSAQVIANKAKNEQWPTPKRLRRQRRELGLEGVAAPQETETENLAQPKKVSSSLLQPDCNNPETGLSSKPDSPISRFHAALMALVDSPPADFQAAFAGVAQAAIAEGLPEIPAPRSIKELATWFDLWRKAAGLDIKEKAAGMTPLVNPMRTVSRRAGSQVIDAEPLPGTPEFEAWEV